MKILRGRLPENIADFNGSGYGDGSGSGSGDGYGYGSGYGSGYWISVFASTSQNESSDADSTFGFWWSDANGQSANGGGRIGPARPGVTHTVSGPLKLCSSGALHATLNPSKWKGDRLWLVALRGETQREEDKIGALHREIIAEMK